MNRQIYTMMYILVNIATIEGLVVAATGIGKTYLAAFDSIKLINGMHQLQH